MKASEKDLRDALSLKIADKGCKNYSIKAGAGGGKTTLLSERISRQIIDGTPIEEFVIITYTNAAANELRDKISERLREFLASGVGDENKTGKARDALNSIELIQISTIHAFLLRILREHSFEAGIVPDVKVMEEEENDARRERFFNKWYRDHFDEIGKFRDDWMIHFESSNLDHDVTREVFLNIFNDIADIREEIIFDTKDHTEELEKAASEYVTKWLPELVLFKKVLETERPLNKNKTPKTLNNDMQKAVDNITEAEAGSGNSIDKAIMLSQALKTIIDNVKYNKKFYKYSDNNDPFLEYIPDIPDNELEWKFETLYNYMLISEKAGKAVEYVCAMQKEYQKENDDNALTLSNNDILFRADRLLSEHTGILDKLRNTYSKIYVDEFQDTTGLQARLIKLLAGKKDTGPAAEDIEEDKLIVVGDPKQSIYRFTGAELSVYEDVDGMMAKMSDDLAESVSLDTNFRSNKDIVDWVNVKFGKLMGSSYSPMDTDWIVSEKNALHGVYGYAADLETDDKGNPKNYKKEDDVSAVAELVSSLVNNSHCFIEQPVRNEDGTFGKPLLRKIKYSDIMIICRNTKKMKNYAVRFAECDIPVNVQGKFKADDDEVLRNFVLLTEYLADPKNKKKRATAVQIISGIDVTKASIDESKKAEEDLKDLITLFRDNSMNTAAIMRYLLSREELFLPRGKEFSPGRIKEYRIRLNQMVETCLADNDGDISRLSDLMNDYIKKVIKREIPLESNEDALQLMNVHQAKGLTGQIVIIADRTNEDVCKYSGFKSDGKYYPAVRYKKSGKNESGSVLIPSYGNDINRLKQAYTEDRDESVRLQYVAATRAAHALIIMPAIQKDAWFTKDVYDYKCLPDINKWLKDRNADTKTYDLANETEKEEANDNLSALEKNKEKADSDSLSEKQLISITPSELERPGVTGYSATDKGYAKEDRPGGDVFGTVMHRVYELMFTGYARLVGKDPEDRTKSIDRIINRAILENIDDLRTKDDPKAFSEFLSSKMSGRFETTIRPIMDEAEEIYPEYTFSFFVEESERDAFISDFGQFLKDGKEKMITNHPCIWVNGQADLVVRKKDGSITVYDHKSDAMNGKSADAFESDLYKKYEGQLTLYKYAIGKAFGVSDVKTELIHLYK